MASRSSPTPVFTYRGVTMVIRVLALLTICLASSCGAVQSAATAQNHDSIYGQSATVLDSAQVLGGFPLPSPSALLAQLGAAPPRRASYAEADLVKSGIQTVMPPAPHNRVEASKGNLIFHPQWSEEVGMSFDGLACAVYHFEIEGYDRNQQICYTWGSPPDPTHCWLLLANWETQRWDLFAAENDRKLDLPSLAPYFDALGNLFVAIICTGTDPVTLRELRVGSELPLVQFVASPKYGMTPLSVHLDPTSSYDPDGAISKLEWDFDGDGAFDETYATSQAIDHVYSDGGSFTVTLRCTDNDGLAATQSCPITVAGPWVHTWGGADQEQIAKAVAVADGIVYAIGHARSFSSGRDELLLLKYSAGGQLLWARAFSGGVADYGTDISCGVRGPLYVVGWTESYGAGGADLLVQQWDIDGNLVWSRTWGGTGVERAQGVAVCNESIFVIGQTDSFGKGAEDVLFLGYTPDGALQSSLTWGGSKADRPGGIVVKTPSTDVPVFAMTGESASYGSGSTDVLYIEIDGNGAIYRIDFWGGPGAESGQAIACDMSGNAYITGYVNDPATGDNVLLLGRDDQGASSMQKAWSLDGADRGLAIAQDKLGNLFVAGSSLSFGTQSDGLLLAFASDATLLLAQHWDRLDDDGQLSSVGYHSYGAMLLGGFGSGVPAGAWADAAGTLADVAGSWQSPEAPPDSPAGYTETQPDAAAEDLTAGTQDSGGGGNDSLLMLRVVPLS